MSPFLLGVLTFFFQIICSSLVLRRGFFKLEKKKTKLYFLFSACVSLCVCVALAVLELILTRLVLNSEIGLYHHCLTVKALHNKNTSMRTNGHTGESVSPFSPWASDNFSVHHLTFALCPVKLSDPWLTNNHHDDSQCLLGNVAVLMLFWNTDLCIPGWPCYLFSWG